MYTMCTYLSKNLKKDEFGFCYIYILSGQKFIEIAKNGQWKPAVCCQTVLPDRSILKGQKLMERAKINKLKWDILSIFNNVTKS